MTLKTIIVTGASKGIGRAIARRLAAQGFSIVVHRYQDAQGASETLDAIVADGGSGRTIAFDVRDPVGSRAAIEADIAQHGAYYGAVINAGIARDAVFPALSQQDWDDVIRTDLDGFYNVLHPAIMPMIAARRGGRIVTIASASGIAGNRGQVNYSAAKAGLIGATKALAVELARRGITVNCVAPGLIETQMIADAPIPEIIGMIPMRRLGQPAEVAAAVAFLCSDDAGYVTRQVISVNGGLL